jgi:four helix bundle protein
MPFSHESLTVYQRTLAFNARVASWIVHWDPKHAICDHLPRAAEGILDNIATASASVSAMKARSLDYAIGSTLECAACLDIAYIRRLAGTGDAPGEKDSLAELLRMLVGLRRAWEPRVVREAGAVYGSTEGGDDEAYDKACDEGGEEPALFHHEKLDVYKISLEVIRCVTASQSFQGLPAKMYRRLDELLTSVLLNVAEGNGRFSNAEHHRFLATAHEASVKAAAKLDLYAVQGLLPGGEVAPWKALLERVAGMTAAMTGRRR